MKLIVDTEDMDPNVRPWLPLFFKAIKECPLKYPPGIRWAGEDGAIALDAHGNQTIPYELVVNQIHHDTHRALSASLGIGGGVFSCGAFAHLAVFSVQV